MKLVAYLRVSTDQQAEHGLGLEVQEQTIRTWAKSGGHRITSWARDEGVSGSNGLDARVGLLDALAAVQDGLVGGVVVYRLDRLARDLNLQEQLLAEVWRMGARVFSTSASEDAYLDPEGAADDPSRTMIRQILGAVAQYERAMIRLRLRAGKARKAAHGGYIGGSIAFGYKLVDGVLVEAEDEQETRERITALRAEGLSLRAIAATLAAEGRKPKHSARWHPESLRLILRAS